MATVLVTGGAGAIGSNVVRGLKARGFDPVVLDDLSSGHRELLPEEVRFIQGSVDSDEDLRNCFDLKPKFVVHMAALFANQNSVEHPERDLFINTLGTLKILEFSQRYSVEKILYTSSSCVYGHKELMDEKDEVFFPETPYAISKLTGERYARFWAMHHGTDVAIVRLFNTYGPGEYPGRYRNVIPNFFKLALEGNPLTVTGDGNETRDFTFVSDTTAGILGALLGRTKPGDIFNLASGRETKIKDLAESINDITGNRAGIQYVPRRSWDQVRNRRGKIDKARETFGFEPQVKLYDGLKQTYEWLKPRIS